MELVGIHQTPEGRVDFREFLLTAGDLVYSLQVGTSGFIESLKAANATIEDPELRSNDTILALSTQDLEDVDVVIAEVQKMNPAIVAPYLQ